MFDLAEELERRIDLENNDYPGTGANNRHDPKTPGTPWAMHKLWTILRPKRISAIKSSVGFAYC